MKFLITGLLLAVVVTGCMRNSNYKAFTDSPLLFCKTVKRLNDIVLENNFPPMIASRNYVYATIAAFEVIAAGDSNYLSLSGQIRHMPAMPKPEAGKEVDFSLAAMLAFVKVGNAVTFPEGSMMGYYDELTKKADSAGIPSEILKNTIAYSDTVANSILAWSRKDNYAQLRSAPRFTVVDSPGRWMPTPPMYAQAVEPHWKEMRTMVMDSASQCMPPRPPRYDMKDTNGVYYKALVEVMQTGNNLTEEQKHIADFWDDNPFKLNVTGHVAYATKKFSPPGHWMNIVGIAAQKVQADFNTTVYAYAKTAIALYEGFISCWDEKYRSNYVRPETVINKYLNTDWRPYIQTPPFPSYTSGHATISASAAEVMTEIFSDRVSFTDTSLLEFGIKNREILSFRGAAGEAAMSRLYGGIHYRFDNEEGSRSGKRVGELIVSRLKMKR